MIYFVIAAYLFLAIVFILSNVRLQCVCAVAGTLLSSFMAYWYLWEDDVATIIYIVLGIVCIFFFWVVDEPKQGKKNKYIAAALALLLGSFGVHRFYTGKRASGMLYLLFCWTNIPFYLGVVEFLYFLLLPNDVFEKLYNVQKNKKESISPKPDPNTIQPKVEKRTSEVQYTPPVREQKSETITDEINYGNITSPAGLAKAKGNLDSFVVSVYRNNKRYEFQIENGQMISYKSPKMTNAQFYEGIG